MPEMPEVRLSAVADFRTSTPENSVRGQRLVVRLVAVDVVRAEEGLAIDERLHFRQAADVDRRAFAGGLIDLYTSDAL
ncbi:hypothetical protein UU5_20965 [Rhodanobacter sp. 115]|nr:hypothetical protein UU5_20965 [Rhodanobacter sp. 115]